MRLYLKIPPPVRRVHFCVYPLSISVVFLARRVDEVISVGNLWQEISDSIYNIAIEEWQCSLAIINLSFIPLKICTARIQCLEEVFKRMQGTIPGR